MYDAKVHSRPRAEKLARRMSHILALLHQGQSIDKRQIARDFQVDVRTIDRDLGERLYGIAERNAEGRWQLSQAARATVPVGRLYDYARLSRTEHLFPDDSLGYLLAQFDIPEGERPAQVLPIPHEDVRGRAASFAQLETAITQRRECCFTYKGKRRLAQPYRLMHKLGIWYLAAVEGGRLKNFSVSLIEALEINEESRYTPQAAIHDYLDGKDDVWIAPDATEALLRVAPPAAHYFARRALLPRQHHQTEPDGSLRVTTLVSHPQQLLPVVRYWLPHVRIVRPASWHDALVESLRQALKSWDAEPTTHPTAP